MSYHNRNSSRSGASPIIKDILRGALDALTEPSSSRSRGNHEREYPRRTATQPEPRRHRDGDPSTGIPSHSYTHHDSPRTSSRSGSNTDDLKEMLGKAAVELSRLVSNFEERLKVRKNVVDARPGEFVNDDERFEVLDDSDADSYHNNRSQPPHLNVPNHHQQRQQHHQQQPQTPRGLANEYYYPEYLPGYQSPSTPTHPQTPNPNANPMSFHHPQPLDPTYPDYHHPADTQARPKPKRSSTSTSQTMRKVGSEILQNLPQLLARAGWLLKVLEGQQKRSGGSRSITGYSGLLMALNLVVELYKQFGGEKREREREKGGRSRERERERRY